VFFHFLILFPTKDAGKHNTTININMNMNNHTSYQRGSYNPIPSLTMVDENKEAQDLSFSNNSNNNTTKNRKALYITTACILFLFGVFMIKGENQGRGQSHHMMRVERRDRQKNKKDKDTTIEPTLKPNGGRDWTINIEEGTISAKHSPDLVLGSYPHSPLVLTHRGESNQVVFPTAELQALKMQGRVSTLTGIGLQFPQDGEKDFMEWKYAEMGVSTSTSSLLSLSNVEFTDDNFITWRDNDGNDMVLDVSLWAEVAGNTVNLVRANPDYNKKWWSRWFPPETFKYGGGRDWVINLEDGTIGCKNTPYLVLGYGPIQLLLMEKGSSGANTFDKSNLEALANNETTTLTLTHGSNTSSDVNNVKMAIGKLQDKEQYLGPYRYIQSSIVPESQATPLKYIENNYIATAEPGVPADKALVLDVSFWNMVSGNTVNFVGGWTWEATTNDGNDAHGNDNDNHKEGDDDGYYKNIGVN